VSTFWGTDQDKLSHFVSRFISVFYEEINIFKDFNTRVFLVPFSLS
jgi:hypothetical protein